VGKIRIPIDSIIKNLSLLFILFIYIILYCKSITIVYLIDLKYINLFIKII